MRNKERVKADEVCNGGIGGHCADRIAQTTAGFG
jgi:hypothetical protein